MTPETVRCTNCRQEVDAAEPACPRCGHLHVAMNCARHPDWKAAGQCVICSSALCGECAGEETRHYLCPDHREIEVIEGWAQVYSTGNDVEAGLIRENLQAEGIDAAVFSQKDHMLTVELGDLSPVRLLVPAYQYEQAQSVLTRHMDERGEVVFACPACGEAYEPGENVCPACGQALPSAFA